MVQETDKIKDYIDAKRGSLERDLHEIEQRVRKAVDWREWFDRKPLAVLGAATAGGFVLSLLMRRSSSSSRSLHESASETGSTQARQSKLPSKTSFQMSRVGETFDNAVAAMLGVASHKIRDFISDAIPNFREEYREVEEKRAGSRSGPIT